MYLLLLLLMIAGFCADQAATAEHPVCGGRLLSALRSRYLTTIASFLCLSLRIPEKF